MLGEAISAARPTVRTYRNPVYDGYFADPFIFSSEGSYFAVGTCDSKEGVFPMLRSADLVEWEPVGPVLTPPPSNLGTHYWAPEIAYDGSRFTMYYSVGFGDRSHRLRAAQSNLPTGPYVDLGIDLIDPNRCGFAIDPSPFQDLDGSWHLFYARDFLTGDAGERPGTALVVDRLETMSRLAGEERVVLRATKDWQRFMEGRPIYGGVYDWHTLEGPNAVRHEGKYYCFYSGGRWEDESYGVDYAQADSLAGPWIGGDSELPRVLRSVPGKVTGPGHNSLIRVPDGGEFLVYHAWDAAMKARQMCLDKLLWTPEGPRCAGPTRAPQSL